jgi:hypothetical protein
MYLIKRKFLKRNDIIYKEGDDPSLFYILK